MNNIPVKYLRDKEGNIYSPVTSSGSLYYDASTSYETHMQDWVRNYIDSVKGDLMNFDKIFPVGYIYMSVNSTNPSTLFGGTWEQLQNRFLLAAGSSYSAGSTGGEATVALQGGHMPTHSHGLHLTGTVGSHAHSVHAKGVSVDQVQGGAPYDANPSVTANTSEVSYGIYTLGKGGEYAGLTGNLDGYVATTTAAPGIDFSGSYLDNAGSGAAHNNMPPYLVVYMWKKTGKAN